LAADGSNYDRSADEVSRRAVSRTGGSMAKGVKLTLE